MAEEILLEIFCTAVQAFLPAGRSEGRIRRSIAERRSAYAKRCLRASVAERARKAINHINIKLKYKIIFDRKAIFMYTSIQRATKEGKQKGVPVTAPTFVLLPESF